jgi:hypothetical protein
MMLLLFIKPASLISSKDILLPFTIQNLDTLSSDKFLKLNFDLNTIDSYLMGDQILETGSTVFITLSEQGNVWCPDSLILKPPTLSQKPFIKGTVARSGGLLLDITYGFEIYPISSLTSQQVDFLKQYKQGIAKIKSSSGGTYSIQNLYINGRAFP